MLVYCEMEGKYIMILAIDIGNTKIIIGCMDDENIYFVERLSSNIPKTDFEYAVQFKNIFEIYDINVDNFEGIIISSVVPPLIDSVKKAIKKIINKPIKIVGPGIKTGLNILMDNPAQIGSDLVVNAVAALEEYSPPLIVINMGTATTFTVIDKDKNYIGGMIMPGVETSLNSLVKNTSQLQRISIKAPKKLIGKNTIDSMKSGIIIGHAASIDGLIERIEDELGEETVRIATGSIAPNIIPHCRKEIKVDDVLLLKGLKIIFDMNNRKGKGKC